VTIEIQKPELEALIRDCMRSGAFANVEDALIRALKNLTHQAEVEAAAPHSDLTGAALVAAMQASPCKEIDLEPVFQF
jgi:hypothetical protein